jgi:WD40 repeat protein
MTMILTCTCGQQSQVREEFAGQQARCPSCQRMFIIPYPGQQQSYSAAEPALDRRSQAVDYDDEDDDFRPERKRGVMPWVILAIFLLLLSGTGFTILHLARQNNNGDNQQTSGDQTTPPVTPNHTPVVRPPVTPTPGPVTPTPTPVPTPTAGTGNWEGHTDPIINARFTRDGQFVISSSGGAIEQGGKVVPSADNGIRKWDAASGRQVTSLKMPKGMQASAVSPDGGLVAFVSLAEDDSAIHLWQISSGREIHAMRGHDKAPFCLAFSADGKQVVSGGPDRTVRLWDVDTGREAQRFVGHRGAINGVAISADGQFILSAGGDRTARLWDVRKGVVIHELSGHLDIVWAVAFSPDASKAFSAGGNYYDLDKPGFVPGARDHDIRVWDRANGQVLHRLSGHQDAVVSLAVSADGRKLLSGSKDGEVRVWHVPSGRLLETFSGHKGTVNSVAFFPDARRALSAGEDHTLRTWKLPPDVQDYIARLGSGDAAERVQAVAALRDYGQEAAPAIAPLLRSMDGASGQYRKEVIEALEKIGTPQKEHAALLVPLLKEASYLPARTYALDLLLSFGPDARPALAALAPLVRDPDASTRTKAIQVLGNIGTAAREPALVLLVSKLTDEDKGVQDAAREALTKIGPPTKANFNTIRFWLRDQSETIRAYAIEAVGQLGDDAAPLHDDVVAVMTLDPSPELRKRGIKTLLSLKVEPRRQVELLTKALEDRDVGVCVEATKALGQRSTEEGALPALMRALRHDKEEVAEAADAALATHTFSKKDVPLLREQLKVKKEVVRKRMVEVLIQLGKDAVPAVPELADVAVDSSSELQLKTLEALANLGPAAVGAGSKLAPLLDEEDPVRMHAAFTLAQIGSKDVERAIPFLVVGLYIESEDQVEFRKKVADTLIRIGRPAVKPLIEALDKRFFSYTLRNEVDKFKAEARLACIQVLGEIGTQGNYPEILLPLAQAQGKDPDPRIRALAKELRIKLAAIQR